MLVPLNYEYSHNYLQALHMKKGRYLLYHYCKCKKHPDLFLTYSQNLP